METKKSYDDGGPVGAYGFQTTSGNIVAQSGISILELFAGQALLGMLASESQGDGMMPSGRDVTTEEFDANTAKMAYRYADAMIAEKRRREAGNG